MWLTQQLNMTGPGDAAAAKGAVTLSGEGGLCALGASEARDLPVCAPGGMAYMPLEGERVVLLNCGGEQICLGVLTAKPGAQPGEVAMCSAGGACIRLKNNGDVVINGLVIDKEGVLHVDG